MGIAQTDPSTFRRPLRLWPGVVGAALLLLATLVAIAVPEVLPFAMMGAVAAGLAIVVWWAFFSRAPWSDRLGAVVLMVVAVFVTRPFLHPSIAGAGMGMLFYFLALPVLSLGLVAWAVASRRLESYAAEQADATELDAELHGAVCRCVGELAAALKPEYAAALRRIEIDGVSVKDYAAEAGISASNAGVRVFRAREALRRQVARACGTCADHGCLDCPCAAAPGAGACAPH